MSGVVESVEAEKITVQHTVKNLLAHRQNSVDLTTREGRVQEESDHDVFSLVAELLSQHRRQQHQMVVVDPDHVVILHLLRNFPRKDAVGITISNPCVLVEANLAGVVMEQRPKNRV